MTRAELEERVAKTLVAATTTGEMTHAAIRICFAAAAEMVDEQMVKAARGLDISQLPDDPAVDALAHLSESFLAMANRAGAKASE